MDRTILVTGAKRGLGLEFVRQYAEDGERVLAACRSPGQAEHLAAIAERHKNRVHILALDVADGESRAALKDRLGDQPIDILINNAGIYGGEKQKVGALDESAFMETIRTNTFAPLALIDLLTENLAASATRKAVTISSGMGSIAETSGGVYAYRVSKTGVNMVMRCLAADLRAKGIFTLALCPGWVRTDMGGAGASLSPRESVAGMKRVIESLDAAKSGQFRDYLGNGKPF